MSSDQGVERPVVLLTGCSSGIGRAAARVFAARGFFVYASMRRVLDGDELIEEARARGWMLKTPILDVTDEAAVRKTVADILAAHGGRLDAVINNAGYYCVGPIEETAPDELRAQLETNVIGILNVCRAVLPAMRARRVGAIVNVSSTNGRAALPMVGPYQISKFGVEALTETLRYEVAPFGIRVVCVEPGSFATDLHRKQVRTRASADPDSPYRQLHERYRACLARLPRARTDAVAETLYRAATDGAPPMRLRVGPFSFLACVARYLVPDRLYEALVRFVFRWGPRTFDP